MTKHLLPLTTPPKTSHLLLALPLSIALTDASTWNWYYSEFIQLYTFRDNNEQPMFLPYNATTDESYAPLEQFKFTPDRLKLDKDIVTFIKLMIRHEYYVCVFCNDFYISNMDVDYQRIHEILINGYDDEKSIFNVYAYVGPKLKKIEVSYQEFLNAYYSEFTKDLPNTIILYRKRKNQTYSLNIEKIKWHLLDYIEGVDTSIREKPHDAGLYNTRWGIDTYDEILVMYTYFYNEYEYFPYTDIYCFLEHKNDNVNRIKYLEKNSSLSYNAEIMNSLESVKNNATLMLNLQIKANHHIANDAFKKDIFFNKIESIITRMRDVEHNALKSYYAYNSEIFRSF